MRLCKISETLVFITISKLSDGTYIDVNPAAMQLIGYSRAEMIGRSSLDIRLWLQESDRRNFMNDLEAAGSVKEKPAQFRIRSGEIRDVEFSASILEVNKEKVLVSIVRDVTERKQKDKEILQQREQLRQKNEELFKINADLAISKSTLEEAHNQLQETEKRIRHLALHDFLTNLPNRAFFLDSIKQAVFHADRNSKILALMFVDIDNFKSINDSLGHKIGDALLQAIAKRLLQCVRKSDVIARLGGDEFVLCLTDVDEIAKIEPIAQKVLRTLQEPYYLSGHELHSGASIGISIYPRDAQDPETLLQAADKAMYRAKKEGRGKFWFFENNTM